MKLWEALEGRRSIRKYKDTPVAKETLLRLVEAAKLAPNNANVQPWHFVFLTEPGLVAKLKEHIRTTAYEYWSKARIEDLPEEKLNKIVNNFSDFGPVPVYLLVCLDNRAGRMHEEYLKWNELWNQHSVSAALSNLMLAAFAEGLGTCWLGTAVWNMDELKKELGIPAQVQIAAVTPIGYPAEEPGQRPRKACEEIAHFNCW